MKTLSDKIRYKKTPIGWDKDKKDNDYLGTEDVKQFLKNLKENMQKSVKTREWSNYENVCVWIEKKIDKLAGDKLIKEQK